MWVNDMAKQKISILGDWDEGLEQVNRLLSSSKLFEAVPTDLGDSKTVLKKKKADALVFCIQAGSDDFLQRIRELRLLNDSVPVFVYSKDSDISFVVQAIRLGVNDFYTSPLEESRFLERLEKDAHLYELTKKVFMTASSINEYRFEKMIGRSKVMQDNFQMIAAVAKSNATVLITGESGVGKELVAKAIHRRSDRRANKFVDINCGAIPRELLENELFGHEKGAFTGAHKRYVGSFEAATDGTLFLDEISEMDVLLQVKLLRALQERTISRIGSTDQIKVDVRIVAATNRNLLKDIEENRFREDLYYRLNVVNIDIPSLRDRREDIPLLAKYFLEYYSTKNDKIFLDFTTESMEALINYDWPGNVRELENTVERLVVLHDDNQVKLKYLPPHIQKVDLAIGYSDESQGLQTESVIMPLEDLERQAIEAALIKFQGNVSVAAKKLKIGQATLYRKIKKFGLNI